METQLKALLDSHRWVQFLESTALGLQVNLTLWPVEAGVSLNIPGACPRCHTPYPILTQSEMDSVPPVDGNEGSERENRTAAGHPAAAISLLGGISVVVRECVCTMEAGGASIKERALIAEKLLSGFQSALIDGLAGGERAVEITALKQMNRMMMSLFQEGESQAVEMVFDLILSALVILLEARGSWLRYDQGDQPHLLVKGEAMLGEESPPTDESSVIAVDVMSSYACGRLGVLAPADATRTAALLPLMAQECAIIFEIEHLFHRMHAELRRVLGALGSAVLLVNRRGEISYVNSAAEKMLGNRFTDLVGRQVLEVQAPWTPCLAAGTEQVTSGRMDPLLGTEPLDRWVDWHVYPLREEECGIGWLVIADDRTDYYRWQEAARRAERFAVTATMVGSLAHELRNPLSAAKGLVQLIGRKRDHGQMVGYADMVVRELDRATRLLNQFLLLGKPAQIVQEPLDLESFLRNLTPLLEGEACGAGVELKLELEAAPSILADPDQLTQVVLNMVVNALQAVGKDGAVRISLMTSGNEAVLAVRDNGPGLSTEALGKVFQPFFSTKERGTGLGLAVTQAIVHNHGGRITAANDPTGGAVFTVWLPACGAVNETVSTIDVLAAMLSDTVRCPCEQALRAAGLRTVTTGSIDEAIGLAGRYDPAVLLSDLSTFARQDVELVRRALPRTRLMLVGEPNGLADVEGIEVVPQPINYSLLIARIGAILQKF